VLRGEEAEGVLWNGPVLELHTRALARLGPDILERPPRIDAMLERMRNADETRWFGETLLDQSIVAGIGNMWLAEALWEAELSPWRRLRDVPDADRGRALETAATLMRESVDADRGRRHRVYRRVGQPCPRCRTKIRSWGQGDDNRMAYWCPGCQAGDDPQRS
jgi:endonuclease-8